MKVDVQHRTVGSRQGGSREGTMFYGREAETRNVSIALVIGSKNDGYVLRNLRK